MMLDRSLFLFLIAAYCFAAPLIAVYYGGVWRDGLLFLASWFVGWLAFRQVAFDKPVPEWLRRFF